MEQVQNDIKIYFMNTLRISTFIITGSLLIGMFAFAIPAQAGYGLEETAGVAGLDTKTSIPALTGKIVGAGLSLMGILFFGLMLYGGFLWMTARGEEKSVTKAKDTITHAVIGFAIVAGAYAITEFAIDAITGSGGGGGGAPQCQPGCSPAPDGNGCICAL